MEHFAKTIVPECRPATTRFQDREVFVELQHFVKNTSKKLHNFILNGKFNPKMVTIRAFFFSKIRPFFSIFKKGKGRPALYYLVARLWLWMNMHQYLWIFLNILENAWIMFRTLCRHFQGYLGIFRDINAYYQGSEYAWSSYMFDRILKIPRVLNVSEFWTWHGYICKGYTEFYVLSLIICSLWNRVVKDVLRAICGGSIEKIGKCIIVNMQISSEMLIGSTWNFTNILT